MKETIEKHSVKIQILTLISLILSITSGTYVYATWQAQAKEERVLNSKRIEILEKQSWHIEQENYSTRIAILEEKIQKQQEYLYNFKSEIKGDVKEVKWDVKSVDLKIDKVINILLK